jgi:hypothetical protein
LASEHSVTHQDVRRRRDAFVDRVRELAELKWAIDDTLTGRGRLFTLSGEPGVGKSRLSQEATAYAEARGARALWGRCWDHGGAPPFWPWMQVLRGLTDSIEPAGKDFTTLHAIEAMREKWRIMPKVSRFLSPPTKQNPRRCGSSGASSWEQALAMARERPRHGGKT